MFGPPIPIRSRTLLAYNHHDGVPFINQLLDLDVVGRVCDEVGSPRRGFPVMITETIYGDPLGISFEGYPKTTRGAACSPDGPCDFQMAAEYNVAAFTQFWHNWPEVLAVHPFILNNWAWDHFAFVSDGEILPPPGGGNESGGRHAVFVKALNEDGSPVENQKVIASWPTGNPITAVDVLTKGPLDDFWGDFPMSGGNWCPFFPEGPRGPYGAYMADATSDAV